MPYTLYCFLIKLLLTPFFFFFFCIALNLDALSSKLVNGLKAISDNFW